VSSANKSGARDGPTQARRGKVLNVVQRAVIRRAENNSVLDTSTGCVNGAGRMRCSTRHYQLVENVDRIEIVPCM
jgi:hypothetical protein